MKNFGTKKTMREKKLRAKEFIFSCSFRVGLLACIGVFGLLYTMQMSASSTQGYKMSDLQKELSGLENDYERLQSEVAEYRSLSNVQERLIGMNFVSMDSPEYLPFAGGSVAVRN
ncbi:MAG: hypothetical protein COV59_03620 [Candidatus Magasanikbacteria bacterium CG11_big_fil_rev_8_21_14_0_20_39_34]|uniref:Cell division protein FtsL n=1 Tax=Candidatus Magasanikbacteria bacterium CG11_big_fil_rev_8_21_14_0_20_39_34 TaxID=1974653 RepID=A0A2H0N5S0_9BACT|nr:MAG: hypothetical protein COV59_03620 [Candidatus Magasanikbacteria bacterium CG11_big_fil_rev_8_21_14_0_20_39_34]